MKFVIDRTKWYRGKGWKESSLLRNDGMQCCLGQVASQCGISKRSLVNALAPSGVGVRSQKKFPKWLFDGEGFASSDCENAMEVNDSERTTDKERESVLRKVFRKNGDQIVFIN